MGGALDSQTIKEASVARRSDSAPKTAQASAINWGNGHNPHARIPEWVLYSKLSDKAVRLYAVLARFADDSGRSFPSKAKLQEMLGGCARSTLDLAQKHLVDFGALVVVERYRDDGGRTTNDYILNWSDQAYPGISRPGESGGSMPGESGGLEERVSVGTKDLTRFARSVSPGGLDWVAFGDPPKLTLEDGANRSFDAIASSCGVEVGSPRMREVATALNGDKRKLATHPGINRMFWLECARDVDSLPLEVAMRFVRAKATEHPERWQESLTARIHEKARKHADAYDFDLTPSTLAKYWLDIEERRSGFVTSDELRRST